MDKPVPESRHEYFIRRLKEMGMYDEGSDYNGNIAVAVEELSLTFDKQGHSGSSAYITVETFNHLMQEWNGDLPKMPRTLE